VTFYCEEEDSHHTLCFLLFARGKHNSRTHPSKNLGAMMAPLKRIAAASKHLHFYF
jgi:hypothetical protein